MDIEVKAEMKKLTHILKKEDKEDQNELMLRDENESSKVINLNSLGCG